MCGLVGIINLNKGGSSVCKSSLQTMLNTIRHRGPDDTGYYISKDRNIGIGFVRLSIMDIEKGRQPITSSPRKAVIACNGELYDSSQIRNRLKQKGYIFKTKSDTEAFLNMYIDCGEKAFKKINGELAWAIHDLEKQKVLVGKDRFGIKPLYYTIQHSKFIFASEIKAILSLPFITRSVNEKNVFEQMLRIDNPNSTFFKEIYSIPPGSYFTIQDHSIVKTKYWDPATLKTVPSLQLSQNDCAQQTALLLRKAIKKRIVSDAQIGTFLSGGLDSSIIASCMQEESHSPINTFSIKFTDPQYDESPYATEVAKHLGSNHHAIEVSNKDLATHFPLANYHCEHLVQQVDGTAKLLLSQYAAGHVKSVLTGEGADEIFLGYPWFKTVKLQNYWHKKRASHLYKKIFATETARKGLDFTHSDHSLKQLAKSTFGYYPISLGNVIEMTKIVPTILSSKGMKHFHSIDPISIYSQDIIPTSKSKNEIRNNQMEFIKTTLPGYLFKFLGDKMEMGSSLEGRLPFLDNDLVEFSLSLPITMHLRAMRDKNMLRKGFRNALPSSILSRPKHGYSSPILSSYLNDDSPEYFRHFLSRKELAKTGLFCPQKVHQLLQKIPSISYHSQERTLLERLVIFILSFQMMNDMFINSHTISSPTYY